MVWMHGICFRSAIDHLTVYGLQNRLWTCLSFVTGLTARRNKGISKNAAIRVVVHGRVRTCY